MAFCVRARRTEDGTIGDSSLIVEVVPVRMGRPKSNTRTIDQFLFEDRTRVPKTKNTARTRIEIIHHSTNTRCTNHRLSNSVIGTTGLELVLLRSRNSLLSSPRGPQLLCRPAWTVKQRGWVVLLGITKCLRQRTRNISTSAQEERIRTARRTTGRRRRVSAPPGSGCSRRETQRERTKQAKTGEDSTHEAQLLEKQLRGAAGARSARAVVHVALCVRAPRERKKVVSVHVAVVRTLFSPLIRNWVKTAVGCIQKETTAASQLKSDSAPWARSRLAGGILDKVFHGSHHWHCRNSTGPTTGGSKRTEEFSSENRVAATAICQRKYTRGMVESRSICQQEHTRGVTPTTWPSPYSFVQQRRQRSASGNTARRMIESRQ